MGVERLADRGAFRYVCGLHFPDRRPTGHIRKRQPIARNHAWAHSVSKQSRFDAKRHLYTELVVRRDEGTSSSTARTPVLGGSLSQCLGISRERAAASP